MKRQGFYALIVLILVILPYSISILAQDDNADDNSDETPPEYPSEETYDAVLFPNMRISGELNPETGTLTYLILADEGDVIKADLYKVSGGFNPLLLLNDAEGELVVEGPPDIYSTGATLESYTVETAGWYYLVASYDAILSDARDGTFDIELAGTTPDIFRFIIPIDPPELGTERVLLDFETTLSELAEETRYFVPLKPDAALELNFDAAQFEVVVSDVIGVPLATDDASAIIVDDYQWVIVRVTPLGESGEFVIKNTGMADRENVAGISIAQLATLTPSPTFTPTLTPSLTLTSTLTLTPSNTYTPTFTLTPSNTPRISPTPTQTLTPSRTPTFTPTNTLTPSSTPTASNTPIVTSTPEAEEIEFGDLLRERTTSTTEKNYTFGGRAGDIVTIELVTSDFDAYLKLELNNKVLIENDDGAGETNARIQDFELAVSGTYTINVGAFDGVLFSGSYTLALDEGFTEPVAITCPGTQTSQLRPGDIGQVSPEGGSNRVRRSAGTDFTQVGTMPEASIFTVLDGPVCADGYAWYQVNYEGLIGWSAEGDSRLYWLENAVDRKPGYNTVLLDGGRGLTNGRAVNYGNFQVEGYCDRQGYRTANDNREWYCTSGGRNVETINPATFTAICRETYNRNDAYALQIGRGIRRAFRWRCVAEVLIRR